MKSTDNKNCKCYHYCKCISIRKTPLKYLKKKK